jgi:hypothetical protein
MHDPDADDGRTDRDHREPSPSTGHRETASILDAVAGMDHTDPEDVSGGFYE